MTYRQLLSSMIVMGISVLALPQAAHAQCAPLSFCSCTVTATAVSFGNYDPLSASSNDSTGTVRVQCALLVALAGSFTVDLSTGGSGSYTARSLRNGSNLLSYNLYTDSTRSQVWGNGTGGSVRVSRSFSGILVIDRNITVYGRIKSGQNVPSGTYSDTIVVTVTY